MGGGAARTPGRWETASGLAPLGLSARGARIWVGRHGVIRPRGVCMRAGSGCRAGWLNCSNHGTGGRRVGGGGGDLCTSRARNTLSPGLLRGLDPEDGREDNGCSDDVCSLWTPPGG